MIKGQGLGGKYEIDQSEPTSCQTPGKIIFLFSRPHSFKEAGASPLLFSSPYRLAKGCGHFCVKTCGVFCKWPSQPFCVYLVWGGSDVTCLFHSCASCNAVLGKRNLLFVSHVRVGCRHLEFDTYSCFIWSIIRVVRVLSFAIVVPHFLVKVESADLEKWNFENEILITFTFGFGEFESVCISLLFPGCGYQNEFPVERKRSHSMYLRCNEWKRLGVLAMLAACQVNERFDRKSFRQEMIALCCFILIKYGSWELFWVNRFKIVLFLSDMVLVNYSGWIYSCGMEAVPLVNCS